MLRYLMDLTFIAGAQVERKMEDGEVLKEEFTTS